MFWATILLVIGFCLILCEVFIPSGGILGLLATMAVGGAIVLAFLAGPAFGLLFLATTVVAIPALVGAALQVWPHTPMGRRHLLRGPRPEDVVPDNDSLRLLRSLVGQTGVARTKMLPSGAVCIGAHTINAVSDGLPIEPGQAVIVVEVRGNRVVVRLLDDEMPTELGETDLNQPIDSLGSDPFA